MADVIPIGISQNGGKEWDSAGINRGSYGSATQDVKDMRRMGKEQAFQVSRNQSSTLVVGTNTFKRNFKTISVCSFSLAAMMGFVFVPINFPGVIAVAGTGGAIVMYIANFFGFLTIVLSLAEMSSIAPTAGGQYHWVSEFAPPSQQRFLSYLSGWLSSLSWLVGVSSGLFLVGNLIPALISLMHPSFELHAWQGYLFVVALCTLCFFINAFLARYLPVLESFILAFMFMAFVANNVTLLVLSPKLDTSEVFQTFDKLDSVGTLELMASQVFIFYSLLGSDSTAHMAEETQHANIVIPRAMVGSYTIMGLANLVTLIVFCYCFVNPDVAFATTTGYPFLQAFITSTGSVKGAVALTSIQLVLITCSGLTFMASCSRQIFAFARDNGLPFSKLISRVYNRSGSPLNALIGVYLFAILIALVGLGSTIAFNAIVSLQGMAIAATYEVSLLCLIWRRLYKEALPMAYWSLGRSGLIINVLGALYGLYLLVYSAMPPAYPVTAANLNWAPVMFGGVVIFAVVYYLIWARKIYEGPVVYVKREH